MRALIRTLLIDGLPVDPTIPAERWLGSRSITNTPPTPFAVIRFGGTLPGLGALKRRRLEVWVHDAEGDYTQIEEIMKYIRDILDNVVQVSDGSGNEVVQCDWQSDSVDLYDDQFRTNCMMTSYTVIGKEV